MLLIIQARSNSKRFKSKILYPIYGIPLIQHVINKVNKSKKIKELVVSTSKQKTDNELVNYLNSKKINFFRGSLNNVALRLYETAKKYNSKYFIRISGDSPLIDYRILNKAINLYKKSNDVDLITNVYPRTYPKGQSVEIIKNSIIKKNLRKFSLFDKEHVTTFFYKNAKNFKIKNLRSKKKYSFKNLSVDTIKNLNNIIKKFDKKNFNNFRLK